MWAVQQCASRCLDYTCAHSYLLECRVSILYVTIFVMNNTTGVTFQSCKNLLDWLRFCIVQLCSGTWWYMLILDIGQTFRSFQKVFTGLKTGKCYQYLTCGGIFWWLCFVRFAGIPLCTAQVDVWILCHCNSLILFSFFSHSAAVLRIIVLLQDPNSTKL